MPRTPYSAATHFGGVTVKFKIECLRDPGGGTIEQDGREGERSRDQARSGRVDKVILELFKKENLYAKFSKCEFWLQEVQFLGHVINGDGLHVYSSKIEVVINWEASITPSNVHSFLRLTGYYRRFTDNFSKLAKPFTILIQKHKEENVVADALSRKERFKPNKVQAMNITIQSSIKDKILAAQNEASEVVNAPAEMLLRLPEELNDVHDMFHVSNLKKCLADPTLHVPLKEIEVNAKLNFVEELVEILEHEFKKLKRSRISIFKVLWNLKQGPEFTWERED
uniref:Putative reverse transcriptase domain-containing protein n=1 Tax=Tanacetum cinerariifolium TaxID=118510 RepID=A0A699ICI4_TANCI|nr:putative reverse transcriptase domain-containing protein [Tanacetum cinerariifolium]